MLSRAALRAGWQVSAPRTTLRLPLGASRCIRRCHNTPQKSGPAEPTFMESARSNASWVHAHASELALGAGGLVVLYGATKASVWLTSELLSISFTDVAWAGFWAGAFSAVAAGVAVNLMVRTATIRPERLYRAAMQRVQRSEAVQAALGRKLEAGHLRAYVLHPGHVGFTDGKPGWVPPTVQMLYMVRGPDKRGAASEAMVTVEAVKSWPNRLQYKLLCVDPLDGPQVC